MSAINASVRNLAMVRENITLQFPSVSPVIPAISL